MGASRRTIVWLAPEQVPLVREVAKAAELTIVGVGSSDRGRAASVADELGVPALAGAASILVFFGYIVSDRGPTRGQEARNNPPHVKRTPTPEVPALVREKAGV